MSHCLIEVFFYVLSFNNISSLQGGREILESLGYTEYTGFTLQVTKTLSEKNIHKNRKPLFDLYLGIKE